MTRVIVLVNGIAPYRIPVYNHLASQRGWEFEVAYLTRRTPDRQWLVDEDEIQFPFRILPGLHFNCGGQDWNLHINPTALLYLASRKPDVVITAGYDTPAFWAAWVYRGLRKDNRLVLWGSSTFLSSKLTDGLGWRLKKLFASRCDASVTYSTLATEYVAALGIPRARVVTGCNIGSVEYFQKKVGEIRADPEFRTTQTDPSVSRLVFTGKLIRRKGLDLLLEALTKVSRRDWQLWVVGAGSLRPGLERVANALLPDKVQFKGFAQRGVLAQLLASAAIGIIPSTAEVGSVVLSEYLASGLYVIASKYDASAHNLIVPGLNGVITDPWNTTDLGKAVETAIALSAQGHIDRQAISDTLQGRMPRDYAGAVAKAVEIALG